MKKIGLVTLLAIFSFVSYGETGDIVTLKTNQSFKGEIVKVKKTSIVFKAENGENYTIPANDLHSVSFGNNDEKSVRSYQKLAVLQENACMKGAADGKAFHGKGGLHVALGALFGPFAVIGAAVGSPQPMNGARTAEMSKNSDLFTDPQYLECYKKAARGKNVGMAAAGWGMWILLLLI